MKNNKGFSLIELLGVIVILGILSGTMIISYSNYRQKALDQAYETLKKNTISAAEEYFFDKSTALSVDLDTLFKEKYISNISDPKNKSKNCSGTIYKRVTSSYTKGKLDETEYTGIISCSSKNIDLSE